jgi:hypothetical protein
MPDDTFAYITNETYVSLGRKGLYFLEKCKWVEKQNSEVKICLRTWEKKKRHLRKKIFINSSSYWNSKISYPDSNSSQDSVILLCTYITILLILLANDTEKNPGPSPIGGICRTCGTNTSKETDCLKVTYFIANYLSGLKNAFHHGEELAHDHFFNPKYLCDNCAKLVRLFSKQSANDVKRQKVMITI